VSYQAIARKWRPITFDEIVGQPHVTRTLQNAIRLGRIHHAFLFTGARGVGKTTAARAFARALNCDQGPTVQPCGTCGNCSDVLAGNSPDVIEIDGASNNSVDDVRDLRETVRYVPARGRYKVYIVDEVHMLSKGAFNALLKTLEEPPPHVVFIFATTEPQKIPETILSRVQRFDFKRMANQVVVDRLRRICDAEGVVIGDDALRLIARAGEGSMRDAQSLLDQVIAFVGDAADIQQVADVLGLVDRGLLYSMLEGMLQGRADPCLAAVDQVYNYGYDLGEFTSEMLELLRNAALVGLSPDSRRYLDVGEEEQARLLALAQDVPSEVFVRSFQVMLDVHEQVARSTHPRMVLEMAVARLVSIRPARPMDQVLERLTDLERRLRQGGAAPRARSERSNAGQGDRDDSDGEPAPDHDGPPPPEAHWVDDGNNTPEAPPQPAPSAVRAPPAPAQARPSTEAPRSGRANETPSFRRAAVAAGAPVAAPPTQAPPRAAPRLVPPTPPPAGSSNERRYALLRDWLRRAGVVYEVLVNDSAFVGVGPDGPVLEFPSEFKRKNAARLLDDDQLQAALRVCFPESPRLVLRDREAKSEVRTRREVLDLATQDHLRQLRLDVQAEPVIVGLLDATAGELVDVRPDGAIDLGGDSFDQLVGDPEEPMTEMPE
jgi:DNA polymerase III subunit gamma/tau